MVPIFLPRRILLPADDLSGKRALEWTIPHSDLAGVATEKIGSRVPDSLWRGLSTSKSRALVRAGAPGLLVFGNDNFHADPIIATYCSYFLFTNTICVNSVGRFLW